MFKGASRFVPVFKTSSIESLPRILANTLSADGPLSGNTYPQWYDPLGRYIFAGTTINFRGI